VGRRRKKHRLPEGDNREQREPSAPGPKRRASNPYATAAVCGLLLLAIGLVFGQTLRHAFVNVDDDKYVYENRNVSGGLTVTGIAWAFTHSYAHNWHPLTWLSHMLDCQLYGLEPWGHHLTNLLLHAAATLLLFLVLRQMTGDLWPSALVAAVFAVHPLHVESVAWVAERKDVLSGLFLMLTLGAYVGYVRHGFSWARYLAVVVLFAMGLMAKPMLVTLPLLLLLLDYWPLGRFRALAEEKAQSDRGMPRGRSGFAWRLVVEKLPLVAMAIASSAVTVRAQHEALRGNQCFALPWRIGNALTSYATYLGQLFYPADLAVFYPHPADSLPIGKAVAAFLLLAAITAGVWALRRRAPYLVVGWLWYLGSLVPVIGLVQVGEQAMADRYTYLTQIGIYLALAWGVADVWRAWPRRRWALGVASAAVIVGLTASAWRQASYWCNNDALWEHALACTSRNNFAHNNLGNVLLSRGQVRDALDHFQAAMAISPGSAEVHNNLANALLRDGQRQEAIEHYREASKIDPQSANIQYNLGVALIAGGRLDVAIGHFKEAVRINPEYADAHNNLGAALGQQGLLDEAIVHFQKALAIQPDLEGARRNLEFARARQR
jgi:protein O-mannosyl-transferase